MERRLMYAVSIYVFKLCGRFLLIDIGVRNEGIDHQVPVITRVSESPRWQPGPSQW